MVHTPVDINEVKQLAATGHFRSIALWLNYPLVPQSIYARVQTGQYPGYLQVLLEFERPPNQDTLIRLVCHRICRLESDIILGIHFVGRLLGAEQPLWQKRVKLSQRKRFAKNSSITSASSELVTTVLADTSDINVPAQHPESSQAVAIPQSEGTTITATTYGSEALMSVPSYLIPKKSNHQERRRRNNRSIAPSPVVQIRPSNVNSAKTAVQRRESRRRFAPKEIIEQQFNYVRAIVVTGSAAAAFILGCMTEVVMFQRGEIAKKSEPTLPTFDNDGWRTLSDIEAQEIAYRSSMRGPAVSAALESVAVMPHQAISDPENPTVTLMFGGEVPVGDVPLQTPEAVGQVLGNLDAFREADLAMVGLGNSLATADTSLQESYFARSRPEAVDALRQGGVDIVGLTGVRTMDYGRQGLIETLDTLDSAGIYRVGAGRDQQEARRPEVLEVKGQRIAYLSYAPDGDEAATLGKAGLNIQERDGIIEDIAALRKSVDWVVVNYRWHGDLDLEPNSQQVHLSRSAIDAGADLVVGYHSDQLQGAELYKSRPIVYSLGDFVFQDAPLTDHDTAALRVALRDKQMKIEFIPISVKEARPRDAAGETAKAILKQIRQASDALPTPLEFPLILEATPQKDSLLKPDKPLAPIKTLGELEPGRSDRVVDTNPVGFGNHVAPGPDIFDPIPFEWEPIDTERINGPNSFQPDAVAPNNHDSLGMDSGHDLTMPTMDEPADSQSKLEDKPTNSLETFNTQPGEFELDYLSAPDDLESVTAPPTKTMSLPKPNNLTDVVPQASPAGFSIENWSMEGTVDAEALDIDELRPEQSDDILMHTEDPLPGYDSLDDWGQKESPHEEFNPIQDHLNSFESLELNEDENLLPAVSVDADNSSTESTATDAISPHHEPLLGPLS
ncbi:MAG: CapA family protein [Leptolyngbya sp. SIO3F4]|nr:CapA family protein [Leptolyngbya sp. SIO3F4]